MERKRGAEALPDGGMDTAGLPKATQRAGLEVAPDLPDDPRTTAIARRWHAAIAGTSVSSWSPADVAVRLLAWTAQLRALLQTESFDTKRGRAIGDGLAALHFLRPAALEGTLRVLGEELAADLPTTQQSRVPALLAALAAGFYQRAHRMVLADQEAIRRAVVAERASLATALQASEARYRAIFEQAALGIALFDLAGTLLEANPALEGILGYTAAELRALPSADLTHPDDVAATHQLFQDLLAGRSEHYQVAKRYQRRDGQVVSARLTASLVRDRAGTPLFIVALIEDVTAMQRAAAMMRAARRQLSAGRKAERQRLARELHDGPVQDLGGVLYRVRTAAPDLAEFRSVAGEPSIAEKLADVIGTVRAICRELRPSPLLRDGLAPAIGAHAAAFAAGHLELNVRLDLPPDGDQLPEPVRVALYRVCEQALRNIAQHAQAHTVLIRLMFNEEAVVLEVRDDGSGFAVPADWNELAQAGHLGVLGLRERAEAIDGRLEVDSSPGSGTLVRATAPQRLALEEGTAE